MTRKESKKLKHSLKTSIDIADRVMTLGLIGVLIEANTPENSQETLKTREGIIKKLEEAKKQISKGTQEYLDLIDETIKKIS